MNNELQELERELAAIRPARVPARLWERIEAGVAALPDPVAAKVVPFPVDARPLNRRRAGSNWLAVAAAVALLGAVAAFFAPGQGGSPALAGHPGIAAKAWPGPAPETAAAARGFVPADSRAGVREVRDEGVAWPNNSGEPLRRVRVVYFERVTLTNAAGEKLEVEVPRVQYLLLPEKIH